MSSRRVCARSGIGTPSATWMWDELAWWESLSLASQTAIVEHAALAFRGGGALGVSERGLRKSVGDRKPRRAPECGIPMRCKELDQSSQEQQKSRTSVCPQVAATTRIVVHRGHGAVGAGTWGGEEGPSRDPEVPILPISPTAATAPR